MAGPGSLPERLQEPVLVYDRIARNKLMTWALLLAFVGLITAFIAVVAWLWQLPLVVTPAVFAGVAAYAAFSYFASARVALAVSGAREIQEAQAPELYRIVENLSIGSGLPMPKVWVIEDSAPNAFATGRSPQGAHVVATRGLLDKLRKRELEAVMAHEMSHVGNYDIRLMTFLAVAVGIIALTADLLLRFTRFGAGVRTSNRGKGGGYLALIILVAAFLFIVISPIVAGIIRLALSRQREYLADSSGALLCRNPDALADALEKIAADPEPLEVANKATAHLYISNPLKGHESFLNNLFSTHPPVEERVRVLRAM